MPSLVGDAIRLWTSRHISAADQALREKLLVASEYLASIEGQRAPSVAFRAFAIDIDKATTYDSFYKTLNTEYPESYAATIDGVKTFLREGAMPHANALYVVFKIKFLPEDLMFDLATIASSLGDEELDKVGPNGFTIRNYLGQAELVARSGTLKRAFDDDRIVIEGYETRERRYWRQGNNFISE